MSVEQFTGTTVLSTLNQQLECSNYQSVQITNNSNYGFTLSNVGNRVVIAYVNPWENIIMPLEGIATLGIAVNNSLNSGIPFIPIQTQELLQVQFTRLKVSGTSKTSSAVVTSTNFANTYTLADTISISTTVGVVSSITLPISPMTIYSLDILTTMYSGSVANFVVEYGSESTNWYMNGFANDNSPFHYTIKSNNGIPNNGQGISLNWISESTNGGYATVALTMNYV